MPMTITPGRCFLAAILSVLLSSPVQAVDNAGWIAVDEPLLEGTWGNSNDDGKTFWGFDEYRQDGTFSAWGTLPDGLSYEADGIYKVLYDGGKKKHCIKILAISKALEGMVGYSFCDVIVNIDNSTFTFQDEDSGELTTIYRVK